MPFKEDTRGVVTNQCCPVVDESCVSPVGDEGGGVPTARGIGGCDGIGSVRSGVLRDRYVGGVGCW